MHQFLPTDDINKYKLTVKLYIFKTITKKKTLTIVLTKQRHLGWNEENYVIVYNIDIMLGTFKEFIGIVHISRIYIRFCDDTSRVGLKNTILPLGIFVCM